MRDPGIRPPLLLAALGLAFVVLALALRTFAGGAPGGAFALCLAGARDAGGSPLAGWSLAPEVLVPLGMLGLHAALARRSLRPTQGQDAMTAAAFAFLALALVSPLCRLAAQLASAHMVQHLILVAVAPPLLVLGLTGRTGAPRAGGGLAAAAALHGLAIWGWHLPGPYQNALLGPGLHLLYLATLLGSAVWFWRAVLQGWRSAPGAAVIVLLATMIHTGLLGALLTFAGRPWYPLMGPGAASYGLSPLQDQQLAGLIMWVPMAGSYFLAALWIIGLAFLTPARPVQAGCAK